MTEHWPGRNREDHASCELCGKCDADAPTWGEIEDQTAAIERQYGKTMKLAMIVCMACSDEADDLLEDGGIEGVNVDFRRSMN